MCPKHKTLSIFQNSFLKIKNTSTMFPLQLLQILTIPVEKRMAEKASFQPSSKCCLSAFLLNPLKDCLKCTKVKNLHGKMARTSLLIFYLI